MHVLDQKHDGVEVAVEWLQALESYDLALPTRQRRLITVGALALVCALSSHALAPALGWADAMPAVAMMALLAGISSLWSP